MIFLSVVAAVLAVARLTRLLVTDRVTVGYRLWVVKRWGADSTQAYFAHCTWCTSFWISLVVIPIAVFWPNSVVVSALLVLGASYVVGLLSQLED